MYSSAIKHIHTLWSRLLGHFHPGKLKLCTLHDNASCPLNASFHTVLLYYFWEPDYFRKLPCAALKYLRLVTALFYLAQRCSMGQEFFLSLRTLYHKCAQTVKPPFIHTYGCSEWCYYKWSVQACFRLDFWCFHTSGWKQNC